MIQVVVCDDEPLFVDYLKKMLSDEFMKQGTVCEFRSYTDGECFLNEEKNRKIDLIFLDIHMPGISGMDVAAQMKEQNRKVVFVTNYEHFVFPALQYYPFYFLRKSSLKDEVPGLVQEFLRRLNEKKVVFQYKVRENIYTIPCEDIMYLTHYRHNVIIHNKVNEEICFRSTIRACEGQLDLQRFAKVNSGTLVNLQYCESLCRNNLMMKNGKSIAISREHYKIVREQFMKFWRDGG